MIGKMIWDAREEAKHLEKQHIWKSNSQPEIFLQKMKLV
jgi:hypothetical protein